MGALREEITTATYEDKEIRKVLNEKLKGLPGGQTLRVKDIVLIKQLPDQPGTL
jgi:hypothetical protein